MAKISAKAKAKVKEKTKANAKTILNAFLSVIEFYSPESIVTTHNTRRNQAIVSAIRLAICLLFII